MVWPARLA
jgi:hypothetical protein